MVSISAQGGSGRSCKTEGKFFKKTVCTPGEPGKVEIKNLNGEKVSVNGREYKYPSGADKVILKGMHDVGSIHNTNGNIDIKVSKEDEEKIFNKDKQPSNSENKPKTNAGVKEFLENMVDKAKSFFQ